jgi:AcrR family transcriptional regulator
MRAVVDLVAEEGLASATASRISARAGVTWGAIAHQFGDKDSLLLSVVEHGFANLSRSLRDSLEAGRATPRERVSLLIDETWHRLNDPSSRAFTEIMLGARSESKGALGSRQEEMVVALTRKIWRELFAGFDIDPEAIDSARKLTFAALLGMSFQAMLGPRKPRFTRELEMLKELSLTMLFPDPTRSSHR